jgi:hypothetical protein
MRVALLFLIVALCSCTTLPTSDRQKALFHAKVLSTQQIGFHQDYGSRWALWCAEVEVNNRNHPKNEPLERVKLYYLQDSKFAHLACGSWPRVRTNVVQRFDCVRQDIGNEKNVWCIRQAL